MSLIDDIPSKRIFDQTAETLDELAAGCGWGRGYLRKFAREMVALRKWEIVCKRMPNGCVAKAYRRSQQKKK